jgi:hypothetical protein
VEAVEIAIWLIEVAPQSKNGKRLLDHLALANGDANPELMRLALKLATGRRQDHRHGNAHRLADGQEGESDRSNSPRHWSVLPHPSRFTT